MCRRRRPRDVSVASGDEDPAASMLGDAVVRGVQHAVVEPVLGQEWIGPHPVEQLVELLRALELGHVLDDKRFRLDTKHGREVVLPQAIQRGT